MTFIGPNRVVSICARKSAGLISSKNPAKKLPALLTSTSIRPNRSAAALTAASASVGSRDVELDGQEVVSLTQRRRDRVDAPGGRDHGVIGGERGFGDVDSHAPTGAGDEPNLLVGHCDAFLVSPACGAPSHRRCTSTETGRRGMWQTLRKGYSQDPQSCRTARKVEDMAGTGDDLGDARGYLRAEIREFLTTRRARITPKQAGLPVYGGARRRVAGLRRDEAALLAGVSIEYYTRLERGTATGVSESVIDGITHALRLDEAERAHLIDLLHTANPARSPRRRPTPQQVRPAVQRVLDSMIATPAFVLNGRLDILSANALGLALYALIYTEPGTLLNTARFLFLDPHAADFFREWDKVANDTVALLHAEAGRDPYDRQLSDLIGQLSTRSDEFRARWAAHDVRIHTTGMKLLHHPIVGDLELSFESFATVSDPGQSLLTYTAERGSPSQDALNLLASWAATTHNLQQLPWGSDTPQAETPD